MFREVPRPAGVLWIRSTGPVVILLLLNNDTRESDGQRRTTNGCLKKCYIWSEPEKGHQQRAKRSYQAGISRSNTPDYDQEVASDCDTRANGCENKKYHGTETIEHVVKDTPDYETTPVTQEEHRGKCNISAEDDAHLIIFIEMAQYKYYLIIIIKEELILSPAEEPREINP